MGRYDFESSGGNAGAAVLDILTKRRAEDRQKMLDEIMSKNSASQRAGEQERILASQQEREQSSVDSAAKNFDINADLSSVAESNPDLFRAMQKRGMTGQKAPGTTPSVSTETSFSDVNGNKLEGDEPAEGVPATLPSRTSIPQIQSFFRGNAEQQKAERIKTQRSKALADITSNPKMSRLEQVMSLANAGEEQLPGTAYSSTQPEKPYYIFDQDTGKLTQADPINGVVPTAGPGDPSVLTHTRPPQPQRQHFQYAGTDADGNPMNLNTDTGEYSTGRGNAGKIGPKPSNAGSGAAGKRGRQSVPANILMDMRKALTPTAGRPPDPNAVAQATNNLVASYDTVPDVKDTVLAILDGFMDPKTQEMRPDNRTRQQLIADHADAFTKADGSVDEAALAQFAELLSLIGR